MYSNHIRVTTNNRNLVLADFWVQSETPLSIQESRHIVTAMGFDHANHQVLDCIQVDQSHAGHKTLVEASLPLPSWKYQQAPDGVRWDKEYWADYAVIDEAITESSAYNLAVNWALSYGFHENDVIGSIKVKVRYIENFVLSTSDDCPF